jgi:hypothetical protein
MESRDIATRAAGINDFPGRVVLHSNQNKSVRSKQDRA